MASVPFIVPTLSPSGAIHFAAVKQNAIAQDVIDVLASLEEVKEDILGDLPELPNSWAIQRIRKEPQGRTWSEDELKSVGNGMYTLDPQLILLSVCFLLV